MEPFEATANLMKVLAHPVRLQIVQVLQAEGEACVCHLEACLEQRQAYISQQLAKLREAGLVMDRRDGLNIYYALTQNELTALIDSAARIVMADIQNEGSPSQHPPLITAASDCPCPRCTE